jgi:hypothetical protein
LGHQVQEEGDKEQDKINAEREPVLFHNAAILLPANILEVLTIKKPSCSL